MNTATATKPGNWYYTLLNKVNELIRKFDLPEDIAAEVQSLTIEVARDQFKAGSKSGVAWILKKQDEERRKAAGAPSAA